MSTRFLDTALWCIAAAARHNAMQGLARRGRSKIWFSDPADCFWLCDDAGQPPLASRGTLLMMVATLMLSGVWASVSRFRSWQSSSYSK